ncbi:hypothetical protein ETU08_05910 [Apibacter muscae]|uniref:Alpha/beta hydrolase n=1 Tax=Apibacter muscae TaxID=2509004 RepID=A0A563DF05_9FLAO|nr:hypothetical protein [Apibacter muscae]TWP28659.1 hypothetical protein ETU09_04900 [Apibacter muscae]TWP30092.1 hypothetical protein ETU08_05910 [Apibacter muscae]
MKKIYFLHGYKTSGKKFLAIKEYYKNSKEYLPIYWEWDENLDIAKFILEKSKVLMEDEGEKIIFADSMGANLAWHIVNHFPSMHYVMTNPVFAADQIIDQSRIQPELKSKIFKATSDSIMNKNLHLIISKNDQTLNNKYYKIVFGDDFKTLDLDDVHELININKYMPLIHNEIEAAFKKII